MSALLKVEYQNESGNNPVAFPSSLKQHISEESTSIGGSSASSLAPTTLTDLQAQKGNRFRDGGDGIHTAEFPNCTSRGGIIVLLLFSFCF